jgi:hypothetical protein
VVQFQGSTSVLDNLVTFHRALNSGVKPRQARFGFVHVEPWDALAIDQKGGGAKLAQTRLYIYPDAEREVLYPTFRTSRADYR